LKPVILKEGAGQREATIEVECLKRLANLAQANRDYSS